MSDLGQRAAVMVRLIGSAAQSWRDRFIREGLVLPARGPYSVAFVDLTGMRSLRVRLVEAQRRAGVNPLVVLIGLDDELPDVLPQGVTIFRQIGQDPLPLARVLRLAARNRQQAEAASVRFRALAAFGIPFPAPRFDGQLGPAAILTEPQPAALPILKDSSYRELTAPLTSSQTLRLLEGDHASALLIHLSDGREHRLPILKLIRRQSDLKNLPVAVLSEHWDETTTKPWLDAGADLLAHPREIKGVLNVLKEASKRFRTERNMRTALAAASITDEGQPSPIHGEAVLERVVAEHLALGDRFAYGLMKLSCQGGGTEEDLAEAGIYLTMALSPVDLVSRPRSDLFFVAMPFADRFYAGATMRTLQTLVEDLKFGDDIAPVLIQARSRFMVADGDDPRHALQRLMLEVDEGDSESLALA